MDEDFDKEFSRMMAQRQRVEFIHYVRILLCVVGGFTAGWLLASWMFG